MKNFFLPSLSLIVLLNISSCTFLGKKEEPTVNTYSNPIFSGFYPDPSICKAEDRYYLVQSSFSYFPGIPIFESIDLVNWTQIGHVLDRPDQLDTEGQGVSRGLFAPAITFHQGTFYLVCTHIDRKGNFVVIATDPAGPWSDPILLPDVHGIDPSLYFEGNQAFIVYNSDPPDYKPLYNGHRTIRMYELDINTLQPKGDQVQLVNGGVDISKEPVWIEAPHIYKINGLYYLMCAEGGTGYNHSEVIFRSEKITGPYEPWDQNPILTQRQLDPARPFPVTTAGHADLIQAPGGDWWAVFLACRPYGDNYYNIGRETFMTPVAWTEDGWPVINPDFEEVQYTYPTPMGNMVDTTGFKYNGNFSFRDHFDSSRLGYNYMFLRTPKEKWYQIMNGKLIMRVRPETASGLSNPSFIGHRQQHRRGSASASVSFDPGQGSEIAGLLFFQSEQNYYLFGKSMNESQPVIALYQSGANSLTQLASVTIEESENIFLKVDFDDENYTFSYTSDPSYWTVLKDSVDGTLLSTKVAGGFVGSVIALYATSNGSASENTVSFDWFEYTGKDEVY